MNGKLVNGRMKEYGRYNILRNKVLFIIIYLFKEIINSYITISYLQYKDPMRPTAVAGSRVRSPPVRLYSSN